MYKLGKKTNSQKYNKIIKVKKNCIAKIKINIQSNQHFFLENFQNFATKKPKFMFKAENTKT